MRDSRPTELHNEKSDRQDQEQLKRSSVDKDSESLQDIHFRDIAPAMEFVCWVVVVLSPFLRWVNGPAVTDDQFAIQGTLFSLAVLGAVGLRLYGFLRR